MPTRSEVKLGRRPKGTGDARGDILRAAQREFGDRGFDRASIRTVARRARVSPGLVYHYFRNKDNLFREAVRPLMRPPLRSLIEAGAEGGDVGTIMVRSFLDRWSGGTGSMAFAGLLRSATISPKAATILRDLVATQITPYVSGWTAAGGAERRVALIASALLGAGLIKFVLGLPGFKDASTDDIAQWVGPTVTRYLQGRLPGLPRSSRSHSQGRSRAGA